MKKYKIYAKGNYLVVVDTQKNEYFYGIRKEVYVDKSNVNTPSYKIFNVKDFSSDTVLSVPYILKEDGSAYSEAEFDTFYQENTGNFNGGGAAPCLSNDISTYTPATTPLVGTEKVLIHDGIDFKEVAVSQLIGGTSSLLRQEFTFSGSQTFTLSNNYAQVYSVEVQGQGVLSSSQYTLVAPNQITILDTLDTGDYIVVIYSSSAVGVQPYYSQAETDILLNEKFTRDWMSLARGYSSIPTQLIDLGGGDSIWEYKYNDGAITLYRRIQNGGLDDAFFETLTGTTVSNQIAIKQILYI